MAKHLYVKTSWPHLRYMPDQETKSPQGADGYQFVEELQTSLKKRWPHKQIRNIPNGVRFQEQFNAFGLRALRQFEVTLR